jgi:hypothetical protein
MLLFRSEEAVRTWCNEQGREPGGIVDAATLLRLAERWYGDRLDPGWRPRTRDMSQAILDEVGLTGAFWRLP